MFASKSTKVRMAIDVLLGEIDGDEGEQDPEVRMAIDVLLGFARSSTQDDSQSDDTLSDANSIPMPLTTERQTSPSTDLSDTEALPLSLQTFPRSNKSASRMQDFVYSCSVCNKKFTRNDGLTTHFRIHTGEKPYVCKFCGKVFTTSCNMTAHARIHQKKEIVPPLVPISTVFFFPAYHGRHEWDPSRFVFDGLAPPSLSQSSAGSDPDPKLNPTRVK